jgi:hypothetical protein
MLKKILLTSLALSASGCVLHGIIPTNEPMTNADREYLQKIADQSLRFEIPKAEADAAWGRAQTFVAKHSSMKIQTASDFVIQTYNPIFEPAPIPPSLGSVTYGYNISRNAIGDKFVFDVECTRVRHAMKDKEIAATADRNARILAHYIITGEMPSPLLVIR